MNTIREIEKINQEELDRGIAGTSASWYVWLLLSFFLSFFFLFRLSYLVVLLIFFASGAIAPRFDSMHFLTFPNQVAFHYAQPTHTYVYYNK